MLTHFFGVNQIIAVGSVDGVCTVAAVLWLTRRADMGAVGLVFTQAFTVDLVDVGAWQPQSRVLFVDLAVNNREPAMTVAFLRRVADAGHQIVGVLDEHNREDWQKAFAAAGLDFDSLEVQPVSGKGTSVNSSGGLLLSVLGDQVDEHVRELCMAADAGDRMDFSTHFGGLVNQAVKSAIADDRRRVYLARHFAENREPDEQIRAWVAEYEAILANHDAIVGAKVDLGDGIVRVSTVGKTVDVTTLMSRLYQGGARVVLMEAEMFDKSLGRKAHQVAFGTSEKVDLLAAVKAVVPQASGFAQKANVPPEAEEMAIAAVRALLRG